MTVPTTVNKNTYTGVGGFATYAYTFRIFQDADLQVDVIDTSGASTTLALGTDYTVTGALTYAGGTITLLAGNLAAGYVMTIWRNPAQVQDTELQNQGAYDASTVEDMGDLGTMTVQAVQDQVSRAFLVPSNEPAPAVLPTAANRANKSAMFDASGNLTAGVSSGSTVISAAMVPVVTAATTTLARGALGISAAMDPVVTAATLSDARTAMGVVDPAPLIAAAFAAYPLYQTLSLTAGDVTLPFDGARETVGVLGTLGGSVAVYTSGLTAGSHYTLIIRGDSSTRTLTVRPGWVFVGAAAPTSVPANKTLVISMTSTGTTDANVVASWAVQA